MTPNPTPAEIAREILDGRLVSLGEELFEWKTPMPAERYSLIEAAITSAYARGRADMREEAAGLVVRTTERRASRWHTKKRDRNEQAAVLAALDVLAAAIRALPTEDTP